MGNLPVAAANAVSTAPAVIENALFPVAAAIGVSVSLTDSGYLLFDSHNAQGDFRISDAGAQYELYRGVDTNADLTAAAWETFSSLPHTSAALAASHTYYFVLRYLNNYGLTSQNSEEWSVEVDAAGAGVYRPSNAENITIVPAAAGAVRIRADYFYNKDVAAYRADNFLVYLTSDGSSPLLQSPTEVAMVMVDGNAKLDYTSGTYADGLTIKTVVRTRNSGSPDVDSDDTTVYSTTSDTDGPSVVDPGSIHFENEAQA